MTNYIWQEISVTLSIPLFRAYLEELDAHTWIFRELTAAQDNSSQAQYWAGELLIGYEAEKSDWRPRCDDPALSGNGIRGN